MMGTFPPAGWIQNPNNPAYYYCQLTEAQLRKRVAAGEVPWDQRIKEAMAAYDEAVAASRLAEKAAWEAETLVRIAEAVAASDAVIAERARLAAEEEAAERADDERCQREWELSEEAVPGYPTDQQLEHYSFVLRKGMHQRYRIPAIMLTEEGRRRWNLPVPATPNATNTPLWLGRTPPQEIAS